MCFFIACIRCNSTMNYKFHAVVTSTVSYVQKWSDQTDSKESEINEATIVTTVPFITVKLRAVIADMRRSVFFVAKITCQINLKIWSA